MKILVTIAYDGGAYHGWQVQPGYDTVQARVCEAFAALYGTAVPVTGCSRTDAGVHAEMFCAALDIPPQAPNIPCESIPIAVNLRLPPDIAVTGARIVADDFHPRYDVVKKEYVYRILNRRPRDPFSVGRAWHYPRALDITRMREAAAYFIGTHDFTSFMSSNSDILRKGGEKSTTIRTIYELAVERSGDIIEIRVSADGFLYNMVRIIVGTLAAVSDGRLSPSDIPELLSARSRRHAGSTAPACGLYLSRVYY
ncbi:MAG: tRNA pseudouridine(38-40) synthase TruA [Eubacteriales bacterium]